MGHIIRLATVEDSARILAIYAPYVENTAVSFETQVPSLSEFSARVESIGAQYPFLVYLVDDVIVAYAYASKQRTRAAYAFNVEVSVYALEQYHGAGIAQKLYICLFEILKEQGYVNAYAGYCAANEKSGRFHEKFGFSRIGVFTKTGYKFGKWHDTVWMEKGIARHGENMLPPIAIEDIPAAFLEHVFNQNRLDYEARRLGSGMRERFDEDVRNYDKWRPGYVTELFARIASYCPLRPGDKALEIGIGTGQATLPFLQTGAHVTAIEIGPSLVAFSKEKFAAYNNFHIKNIAFEQCEGEGGTISSTRQQHFTG